MGKKNILNGLNVLTLPLLQLRNALNQTQNSIKKKERNSKKTGIIYDKERGLLQQAFGYSALCIIESEVFLLYLWFDSSLTSSYYFYQQNFYFLFFVRNLDKIYRYLDIIC